MTFVMQFETEYINNIVGIPFIVINKFGIVVYNNSSAHFYLSQNTDFSIIRNKLIYNGQPILTLLKGKKSQFCNFILENDDVIFGILSIKKINVSNSVIYFIYICDTTRQNYLKKSDMVSINGLSESETEVVILLSSGLSPEEVSKIRKTSINTVRSQIKSIQNKTGIKNINKISSLFSLLRHITPISSDADPL